MKSSPMPQDSESSGTLYQRAPLHGDRTNPAIGCSAPVRDLADLLAQIAAEDLVQRLGAPDQVKEQPK